MSRDIAARLANAGFPRDQFTLMVDFGWNDLRTH